MEPDSLSRAGAVPSSVSGAASGFVPGAVRRYYDPLDAGDLDAALAAFSADASYELPSQGQPGSPADRPLSHGRAEIEVALRRRGRLPVRHEFLVCLTSPSDRSCLIEGRARSTDTGSVLAIFVVAAHWDDEDQLESFRAFATRPQETARALPPGFVALEDLSASAIRIAVGTRPGPREQPTPCAITVRPDRTGGPLVRLAR